MKVLKTAALVGALVCAETAFGAKDAYWGRTSGRWQDASSWVGGYVPQSGDAAYFQEFGLDGPIAATFDSGCDLTNALLTLSAPEDVTDNDGPFEKTVLFDGNGGRLFNQWGSFTVGLRRKAVVDNLHILSRDNLWVYGRLTLRNGAVWETTGTWDTSGTKAPGASIIVDNAQARLFRYWFEPLGKVTVRHGGSVSWQRGWVEESGAARAWNVDWNVIDGNVTHGVSESVWTPGFFPKRSGTFISCFNLRPWNPPDSKWRIGGEVLLTNWNWSAYSSLTLTNSTTLYGRGKLLSRAISSRRGTTNVFDLSYMSAVSNYREISAANYPVSAHTVILGETHFHPETSPNETWQATRSPCVGMGAPCYWRGDNTFHCVVDDPSCSFYGDSRQWTVLFAGNPEEDVNRLGCNTAFRFVDGVANGSLSVRSGRLQTCSLPNGTWIGALEVGDNTTLSVYPNYFQKIYVHDLTLGKNARLDTVYRGNSLYAIGEVSADPSALFVLRGGDYGNEPMAYFCALDDLPDGIVAYAKDGQEPSLPDGYRIDRVGGCFFIWKGSYSTSVGAYCYLGKVNNLWSETGNWANARPDALHGASFTHWNNTVSENDIENFATPYIRFANPCGPFRIYGQSVTVTSTKVNSFDSAIANDSHYPQIIDLDVTSEQEVLGVTSRCEKKGLFPPICFRKRVNVLNGAFAPVGQVVIDGTVNALELNMLNVTQSETSVYGIVPERFPTVLTVRKTGTVNILGQSMPHSTTSSLWIAKGGRVSLTGDWISTGRENEHYVGGTFAVSGTLGGTKSQLYVGKGTLAAGTTDGSLGAKLRIGEGLTLVPTSADFGTMPVEVTYRDVGLAPTVAGTMPQDVDVAALGTVVTVSNDYRWTCTGAWTGYDFDLVKQGKGRLAFEKSLNPTAHGYVSVEEGTLALAGSASYGRLSLAKGTTLELVADEDGKLPTVALDDNLDLSEVNLKVSGGDLSDEWQTVFAVGEDLTVAGAPISKLFTRTVTNDDDSVSFQIRPKRGFVFFFR